MEKWKDTFYKGLKLDKETREALRLYKLLKEAIMEEEKSYISGGK